jgi:hypothetical protein
MQLVVGRVYPHSDGFPHYTITTRWGPELYEGQREGGSGPRYMFNSCGQAIGYAGNTSGPPSFRLKEAPPAYEYAVVYAQGNVGGWHDLEGDTSLWTSTSHYLVREKANIDNVQLVDGESMKEFIEEEIL